MYTISQVIICVHPIKIQCKHGFQGRETGKFIVFPSQNAENTTRMRLCFYVHFRFAVR